MIWRYSRIAIQCRPEMRSLIADHAKRIGVSTAFIYTRFALRWLSAQALGVYSRALLVSWFASVLLRCSQYHRSRVTIASLVQLHSMSIAEVLCFGPIRAVLEGGPQNGAL